MSPSASCFSAGSRDNLDRVADLDRVSDLDRAAEADRARGAWLSLVAQILAALLSVALQVVLARALGSQGFGAYATALAWTGPLAIVCAMGLPAAAVRFVPALTASRDPLRLKAFVRTAERAVLAASVVVAAIGTGFALAFAPAPGPLLVGLWSLPIAVQTRLQTEIARASGRHRAAFFAPLLQPLVMLVGALVALRVAGHLTPSVGVALPATGALVVLPLQRRRAPKQPLSNPKQPTSEADPPDSQSAWIRVGLSVLLVDAAHLLLCQADTLLVGALRGPSAVALLSVAGAVAGFAMFPMIAVGSTAVPAFASLWARGEVRALEALARRSVRRAFTAQVILSIAILLVSKPILAAYGADFEAARVPLFFVLAGQLANTGTGYVGSIMTMTGHQPAVGRSIWLAAAINVALVIAGARLFGVDGAAAGTALSSLGWNVWLHRLVVRHVGVRVSFVDACADAWIDQPSPRSVAVSSSIMPAARAAASTTRL